MDGDGLVGRRRARSRPATVDDVTGAVHGGVDRAAGRVEDGARRQRRVRRQADQQLPASGSASARCSCSGSSTGGGCSRCGTSTCSCCSRSRSRSGSSTAATSSRRCRSSIPGCVWLLGALALDRPHATRAARRRRSGRSGCSPRRRSSWPASASMLNVRASNVIDVGYAGVIGADRIWRGAEPVRQLPGRGRPAEVRAGRRRRRGARPHPDERPLREREPAAATRTGPSRTSPTCPATSSSAGAASGTTCPRRTRRRSSGTCSRCSGWRSSGGASAGPRLAVDARVRLGRVAVHAVRVELEHERPDPARAADLGLLLRELAACARRVRSRSPRWVKFAPLLLVPLWSGYPDTPRRGRPRCSSLGFALATALVVLGAAARAGAGARGARLLGPHDR